MGSICRTANIRRSFYLKSTHQLESFGNFAKNTVFWGNEERSNFWNNKRPITIDKQLEEYVKNFEQYEKQSIIELQEFL